MGNEVSIFQPNKGDTEHYALRLRHYIKLVFVLIPCPVIRCLWYFIHYSTATDVI